MCWVIRNIILEYFRCLEYSGITDSLFDLADQLLSSLIVVVVQDVMFPGN